MDPAEPPAPRNKDDREEWERTRRKVLRAAAGVGTVLAAAVAIEVWFPSRPRPRVLSWDLSAPAATPLKEGARPEPLRVAFSDSAARLEDAGKKAARGVVLKPFLRGAWSWADDRTLLFAPSEDWPAGRDFEVRLDPKLLPGHLRLDETTRHFRTADFSAAIASSEFQVDPRDPKIKRVAATLRFSHPVDPDSLEKRLTLVLLGEKKGLLDSGRIAQPFTVTYDKFAGEAYVVSAPVGIPAEAATMELRAASGVRPRVGGPATSADLVARVGVPGMYDYFHLEGAEAALARDERLQPRQLLIVRASAGLEEKELADSIRAWVLPSTRPAEAGTRAIADYAWCDPSEVGKAALSSATPTALTPEPAEREHPTAMTFSLRAPPRAAVYVKVRRGLAAYGGYVLAKDFDAIVRMPDFPREVKILHDGALLRLSGDKKVSLYALGQKAVRLEIGRVRESELNHLASQTGGDFGSPRFESASFGPDNVTERFEEIKLLSSAEPDRLQFLAFDLAPYLRAPGAGTRDGLFFLRASGWDPKKKRETRGADTRFVLVTDLGVLIKENADKTRDVFVQSLNGGGAVEDASVEAIGLNGLPVASARTGPNGRARLPDLTGFRRERRPAAVVVRKGEDLAFLPFDRQDRRLDVSRFDVGGVTTEGRERDLSADLFSDRGLYRPGEEFHVGLLVRPNVWGQDLAGIPLEASVVDPRGLEVKRTKLALGAEGFEALDYRTQENGPTGAYQVLVRIAKDGKRGALLGSTSVRVEEFVPDRLRIEARWTREPAVGWTSPRELGARVSLHNLFGTPAEGRRVSARLRLTPAAPSFPAFADYAFFDPAQAKKGLSEPLDDATTDKDGAASFSPALERFAAGTYRAELDVEGFEAEGGRGVAASAAVLVSPRPYLVGWKPDGSLSYVPRGTKRTVSVVAAGPDGKAVAVSSVTLTTIEERWVSALIKEPDGLYRYQSVKKELFVSSRTLAMPAAPTSVRLDSSAPGDYALVVRDEGGLELNRLRWTVAGHGNLTRSLEKNAELQVRLDKADYAPGETVELMIKAPYAGAGLISIERDRVYAHKWFSAAVAASTQSIRVPEGLEGNGYVVVTFLRDPASREVFMSPLSHGVAPFTVSRARRTLPLTLTAPETLKPGKVCRVRLSAPRRARAVVFAADEGILQAAAWRTPDPLARFLSKRALEVRTYQILDLLLPEYRLSMAVMAPGGDKGFEAAGKNLNPFKRRQDKPAVFWSGLVSVGPEGREVEIPVPDSFNGALRVTAVAAEPAAIGVTQKKVLVRSALVLTPNAPLFAAPGDEFEASVSVANGVAGSGPGAPVRVTLKPSGHLRLIGEGAKVLSVGEGREGVATFRLRAEPALGAASLAFEASLSSETSRREISLSVRPPVPYQVSVTGGALVSGTARAAAPRRLYPAYRVLEATVSPLPLGLARGLLRYLEKYPYGCTEQIVSQAFPALVLRARPELGWAPETVDGNLSRALEILSARQNEDGAFGFWAAGPHVSEFHAVYAAHFLTEAREKGVALPPGLLERALGHLEQVAAGAPDAEAPPRVRAYAIYVLTRNGRVTTALIDRLRAELEKSSDKSWREDLTAAYLAASCALLHLDGPADALIRRVTPGAAAPADWEWFYDSSVRDAQLLYLLALHFPARLNDLGPAAVSAVAAPLARGRYNSLSSAYAILAFDAYATAAGELTPGEARLSEFRAGGARVPLVLPPGLFAKADFSPAAEAVEVADRGDRLLFYQAVQSGYDLVPSSPVARGLEVARELVDDAGKPVTAAELGREYEARVRLRTTDGGTVPNVAVVDLLPGGFEPARRAGGAEADAEAARAFGESDVREDRVLFFGTAEGRMVEVSHRVKAVARGRFLVPPPYAESMYDRAVYSYGAGGAIEVR